MGLVCMIKLKNTRKGHQKQTAAAGKGPEKSVIVELVKDAQKDATKAANDSRIVVDMLSPQRGPIKKFKLQVQPWIRLRAVDAGEQVSILNKKKGSKRACRF